MMWQKIEHAGSGPWCDDQTCPVCRLNSESAEYREHWQKNPPIAPSRPAPSRLRTLFNFARALFRHVIHGLPYASPADQAERWEKCSGEKSGQPCHNFVPERKTCKACGGCGLAMGQLVSKIAFAGEKCPEEVWGPVKGEKVWRMLWRRLHRSYRTHRTY